MTRLAPSPPAGNPRGRVRSGLAGKGSPATRRDGRPGRPAIGGVFNFLARRAEHAYRTAGSA